MKMRIIKPTTLAMVLSSIFYPNILLANESENTKEVQDDEVEKIQVVGIRGALVKAQNIKMTSSSIVEALSAEDIGKLPDSSIAESLARLPGVAGDRQNGRTSGISIRGFKEDFVGSTMNGRELLGIGFNRGVEYDLYPSEIISGATVYKSSDASLAVTGVGGTVDLQTMRPLSIDPVFIVNGSFETNTLDSDNPDFGKNGHRLAINVSEQFADETFGVSLALASTESPLNYQQQAIRGYNSGGNFPEALWPRAGDTRSTSEELNRDTVSVVLQYRPNDSLDITVDGLYVDFSNNGMSRGFWGPWVYANGGAVTETDGNLVTAGTTAPHHRTLIANPLFNSGDLKTFGLNLTYQLTDSWMLEFDVASSRADKISGKAESYAGVGRSGLTTPDQATVRDWRLTSEGLRFEGGSNTSFDDYDWVRLAGPQAWGGSLAPIQELTDLANTYTGPGNISFRNAQDGFINRAIIEESLDTIRIDLTKSFDENFITEVQFGAQYSERSMSKENFGAFVTAPTFPYDGAIPEQYRSGLTDLSWAGLGQVVAYDALAMFNDNYYSTYTAAQLDTSRLADSFTIEEELTMGYVKLDFVSELDDVYISGNFGVQVVHTKQGASGWDTLIGPDKLVQAEPVAAEIDYTDVLPSLNVNFEFNDEHMIRVSAAKVISRPRFDYMAPGSASDFHFNVNSVIETTPESGPWSAFGGNPLLKPLEANQFDISYEWYFAEDGYLSLGYFNKDLVNWHRDGSRLTDFSDVYIPGYHEAIDTQTGEIRTPGTFEGFTEFKEDGLTGEVDGIEFTMSLPLNVFSDSLDGFGLIYSLARNDGELDDDTPVPGLSEKVDQLTFFYEKDGFSFRIAGTKRSAYDTEEKGNTGPVNVSKQPIELWDAQIGYDFSSSEIDALSGLTVNLKALNITEEDDVAADSEDPRQILKHVKYGSTYMLQMIYKF